MQETTKATNWLTQQEAVEHTKLSEDTLMRWIKSGYLLPGIHYGGEGKLRRFDREMLDVAIRFQSNVDLHQQAIDLKRRSLLSPRRRAS